MFAENLKNIRKNRKMTQQQVADFLKISRSAYNNYEQGSAEPNIQTIKEMSKVFNVSLDILLEKENNLLSSHHQNLLNLINMLSEGECQKLNNFAEGLIVSRQVENKKQTKNIIEEE